MFIMIKGEIFFGLGPSAVGLSYFSCLLGSEISNLRWTVSKVGLRGGAMGVNAQCAYCLI